MADPGSPEAPYLGYSAHPYVADLDSWYPGLSGLTPAMIVFAFDNQGTEVPTGAVGAKMYMTFPGTITLSALEVTPSGSIVLDILKNGVSICASDKPTISSGTEVVDSTLTGWTKTFVAGDKLQVSVDSVSGVTAFCLSLKATRT